MTAGGSRVRAMMVLPGLFNLSGYLIDQLQGQKSVLGRAAYYYRLTTVPVLLRGLYVGLSLELGQVYGRLDGSSATGLLPRRGGLHRCRLGVGGYLAYGHAFDGGLNAIYFYLGKFY